MNLLQEMQDKNILTISNIPILHCKTFEDNSSTLESAKSPNIRPRTKHINLCYRYYREHVRKKYFNYSKYLPNFNW